MLRIKVITPVIFAVIFFSCKDEQRINRNNSDNPKSSLGEDEMFIISADLETDPVNANSEEDSADDPAIFRLSPNNSEPVIAGSNKLSGIHLYEITGREIGFIGCGSINNIDTRYLPMPDGEKRVVLSGSNRSFNSLTIITFSGKSLLPVHSKFDVPSQLDEVYGLCMYKNPKTEECFVFINSKNGEIEQWSLKFEMDQIKPLIVRRLSVPSQPEGMVADDRTGYLYVAEENGGIHIFNADPESDTTYKTIPLSDSLNPMICYDIEGLAICRAGINEGYLMASIQGNNTFAIFSLPEHRYLGSFGIKGEITDSVEKTDGLEIFDSYISDSFPQGILVVQDGYNKNGEIVESQNFKIVDLRKISSFLK